MAETPTNPIVFVGAGPGDPDLITVAGRKALTEADLVVHAGSLVNPALLEWLKPTARREDSAGLELAQIVDIMVEAWSQGLKVVRLHSGDPSLYGAVAEQFALLAARGVPYRVVPGVTAAMAAAAALGLEYTLPEVCQTLILTRAGGRTPVPAGQELADLARHRASLAIYLSTGLAREVSTALTPAYGPEAPVAVVYRASWPDQKIVWSTVAGLPKDLAAADLSRQALILVGPAVAALAVAANTPQSRLYAPDFAHGYRPGRADR